MPRRYAPRNYRIKLRWSRSQIKAGTRELANAVEIYCRSRARLTGCVVPRCFRIHRKNDPTRGLARSSSTLYNSSASVVTENIACT